MKKFNILLFICLYTIGLFAEIPAGYYHKANGKKGYELLNALNDICSNGTFLKYGKGEGYTWEGFHYTDRNEDGSIIDMYSSNVRYQTEFNSVDGMHIEHALPKSWWGALENYAFRDLHHLFPADAKTNITKNNLPLGEVETATFDNGVSKIGTTTLYDGKVKCFEPTDDYKGDFARAYMYISITYNEFYNLWDSHMMENNTYPVWNDEAVELLLKWHREDPVSEKETKRQEAVYQIQHNRNPFIDYPEIAEHIWGNKKEENLIITEDNRAILITPTTWTKIDIPVTYVGTIVTNKLHFEGINFTQNLTLTLKNQSQEITLSKTTITPEELSNGYDLTISTTSNNSKTIVDTLIINTTNPIKLAISVTFSDEFMITNATAINPISADILWTALPNTKEYEVILREKPNNRTADLMFSAYVEGSSYNKAISIYNGTGRTIDLKYYSLRKQSNGTGELKLDYPLSGTLANDSCYVIVSSRADETIKNIANHIVKSPLEEDNIMNFNGNDALALYHNGILTDIIGDLDNSVDWGKDISLKRNTEILSPNTNFNWNEWDKYEKDDFSHLENHTITKVQTDIINTYTTTINFITIEGLTPNKRYYTEIKTDNNASINLLNFTTPHISAPEAYEATDIYATQFTANWEEVNYAEGYIVDLMQTIGSEKVIIEENFDNIGSNGKPLPNGWSGNASGNYTTETSSGKSPNSIALKNTGEYIQTPTTPLPLTYVEFMYRFPSATAKESYFIVYAVNLQGDLTQIDKIGYTNTTKTTLKYEDLQDTYAIKIEYNKVAGNLAIDDLIYKYGGTTTQIIQSEYTTNNFFTFKELTSNTEYSYAVSATAGKEYKSDISNIININTNSTHITYVTNNLSTNINYYTTKDGLLFYDIKDSYYIKIYDIIGRNIYQNNIENETLIPITENGIYIAHITQKNKQQIIKFIIQ